MKRKRKEKCIAQWPFTYMFQIINQIMIADKENLSQYKMQFLNDDFIY